VDAHEGKPYGSIRISTRYDNDTGGIFLSIADSGNGIDPKHLDRIFDPFFTTKPVGKGTGLGLSICYSIIRQLKGNITVKSEPGEGTEFIIFLPLSLSEKETRDSGQSGPADTSEPSQ
jgi:two-component system NtrC family sensor kinase